MSENKIVFTQRKMYVASYASRTIEILKDKDILFVKGYDSQEYYPWQEKSTRLPLKNVLLWAENWLRGGSWNYTAPE